MVMDGRIGQAARLAARAKRTPVQAATVNARIVDPRHMNSNLSPAGQKAVTTDDADLVRCSR